MGLHESDRNKYLDLGYSYFHNRNSNYEASVRHYNSQNRFLSPSLFERVMANGEKHDRKWLLYSNSTGNVFCYVCKLFSTNDDCPFVRDGFSNWKKGEEKISSHENSQDHKKCMMTYVLRMNKAKSIDKKMTELVENEINYWKEVLKRVVAVTCYLAERGLAFRGEKEVVGSSTNGNFLGLLELIAKFDPFLKNHLETHANKGRGHVSYLSKTIFEELIPLLASRVTQKIREEIKEAKYFGLVVDSTPDLSHVDQLTIVIRYCLNGRVIERFLCFIPIQSHTGEHLSDRILSVLEENEIEIVNCRAQTYDNASNMSGRYNGLQAHIKQKSELAFYVPCAAHSLNLVGQHSVDECSQSVNYFMLLEKLYVYFAKSTHRWGVLQKHVSKSIKALSETRWSSRYDAVTTLHDSYDKIFDALSELAISQQQSADTREIANSLKKKLMKLETAFMTVLWHQILTRFNATSKFLQKIDVDLATANDMLKSLVDYVESLRSEFASIETQAKNLSEIISQDYSDTSKRRITKKFADKSIDTESQNPHGRELFRSSSFFSNN